MILVDDIRMIGNNSHHWGKSVAKNQIIDMIMQINPAYKIVYTDGDMGPDGGGLCANDIMVASV
jgi:hypothetical protein